MGFPVSHRHGVIADAAHTGDHGIPLFAARQIARGNSISRVQQERIFFLPQGRQPLLRLLRKPAMKVASEQENALVHTGYISKRPRLRQRAGRGAKEPPAGFYVIASIQDLRFSGKMLPFGTATPCICPAFAVRPVQKG